MNEDHPYLSLIADGHPPDQLIRRLKADGLTIMRAIRIVRGGYGYSLSEAKILVMEHSSYRAEADAASNFHDELISFLESDGG